MDNEEQELISCDNCPSEYHADDMETMGDGNTVCSSCREEYTSCEHCGNSTHQDDIMTDETGVSMCQSCHDDNTFVCDRCCNSFYTNSSEWRNGSDDMCESCYDYCCEDEDDDYGNYQRGNASSQWYQGKQTGRIGSLRKFGIELECYPENSIRVSRAIQATSDGSLEDYGVEYVTPVLSGTRGELLVRHLCKKLWGNARVDASCGYHVHLDMEDFKEEPIAVRTLMYFYMVFENVLLSFLPASRRGNQYSRSLCHSYKKKDLERADTIEVLEEYWYNEQRASSIASRKRNKYDDSRYMSLNLHSFFSHGHGEVRSHSGTLDQEKIFNWIALHCRIFDTVWYHTSNASLKKRHDELEQRQRNEYINSELIINHGVAQAFRYAFGGERINGPREFINKLQEIDKKEVSLTGLTRAFFELINAPVELRAFYRDRQKKFARTEQSVAVSEE